MRLITAFAAVLLLSGCGLFPPKGKTVSPVEVKRNIHVWNGKVMLIEGWLGRCDPLNCGIFSSLEDAKLDADNPEYSEVWKTKAWDEAMNRRLAIGPSDWFDFRARFLAKKKVIIRGRVSDECDHNDLPQPTQSGGQVHQVRFCLDRATELDPLQLYLSY